MDYKAIEAALAKCDDRLRDFRDSASESRDAENYFVNVSCRRLVTEHLDNILRIVRAMGWMEEQGPTVRDSRGVAAVEVYRDGCKETYFGPSVIDAIEAAMAATAVDQQQKGATDGQA